MATLDKIIGENMESIKRKNKEAADLCLAFHYLPDYVDYKHVSVHAYKGDIRLHFEVDDLPDVGRLMEIFSPLPLVCVKDSCTAIFPAECLTEKDTKFASANEIARFYLEVTPQEHYTEHEFIWWSKLQNGMICHNHAAIRRGDKYIKQNGRWESERSRFGIFRSWKEVFSHNFKHATTIRFFAPEGCLHPHKILWDEGVSFGNILWDE